MAPQMLLMDREKIKINVARLKKGGENFEVILEDVDKAVELKYGKDVPINEVIKSAFVYKDAHKAEKVSEAAMKQWLGTTDPLEAAKIIIQKGELNLTAEQRKKMIEQKKQKIIDYISRNAIDSRTGLPIPPKRIELAMQEAKINIDPAEQIDFLIKQVITKLQPILPLSFEKIKVRIVIPNKYAGSAYSAVKRKFELKNEIWRNDGSVQFEIEVPGGMKSDLYSTLNKLTNGEVQIEELR